MFSFSSVEQTSEILHFSPAVGLLPLPTFTYKGPQSWHKTKQWFDTLQVTKNM